MTSPATASKGEWLWRPLIGAMLLQIAVSATRPTTSYAVIGLGADGFGVGVLAAAYAVPPMFAAMVLGRIAGVWMRLGLLPLLSALLAALGCVVSALAADLITLAVGTGLVGLGNIGVLIGAQAWISRSTTTTNYDKGFGWMTAGMSAGQAVGPMLAGFVIAARVDLFKGTSLTFWAAGLICLGVALSFASPKRAPTPRISEGAERLSSWQLLSRPGVIRIIYVSASVLTSVDILGAYLPLLGERAGITPSVIGMLLAARGLASMASRLSLPMLTSYVSRHRLVLITTVGAAATLGMLALVPSLPVMFGVMLVGGFLLGIGQPLTMTAIALAVPRQDRPQVLAIRLLGNRVAQTTTPLVAGGLASVTSVVSVFWLQALMLLTAAGWIGLARRDESPAG